jgi:hypothetical protein
VPLVSLLLLSQAMQLLSCRRLVQQVLRLLFVLALLAC